MWPSYSVKRCPVTVGRQGPRPAVLLFANYLHFMAQWLLANLLPSLDAATGPSYKCMLHLSAIFWPLIGLSCLLKPSDWLKLKYHWVLTTLKHIIIWKAFLRLDVFYEAAVLFAEKVVSYQLSVVTNAVNCLAVFCRSQLHTPTSQILSIKINNLK